MPQYDVPDLNLDPNEFSLSIDADDHYSTPEIDDDEHHIEGELNDLENRPDLRYQACVARGADLRSVERFEIWACEGAGGFDTRGYYRGEDEPTSIASALLVGGARRVVAAPWVQIAGMVAVIGGHFVRQAETRTAEADARRLAQSVRAMRTTLADFDAGRPVPEWFVMAMNEMLGPVAREPRLAGSALVGPWSYVGWRVTARDRDC